MNPKPTREEVAAKLIMDIRMAVADYMRAEGCSCCRDKDKHDGAKYRLAKLLRIPEYSDGSGYDFYRFCTKSDAAKPSVSVRAIERRAWDVVKKSVLSKPNRKGKAK